MFFYERIVTQVQSNRYITQVANLSVSYKIRYMKQTKRSAFSETLPEQSCKKER